MFCTLMQGKRGIKLSIAVCNKKKKAAGASWNDPSHIILTGVYSRLAIEEQSIPQSPIKDFMSFSNNRIKMNPNQCPEQTGPKRLWKKLS